MKFFRFILGFFSIVVCFCLLFLYLICKESQAEQQVIIVDKGCGSTYLSRLFVNSGISDNFFITKVAIKLLSVLELKIQPGEFTIPQHASILQVIRILSSGKTVIHKITFLEGETVAEFIRKIEKNPFLKGNITEIPEEGSLMPDTYVFYYPTTRQQIIDQAKLTMSKFLQKEWSRRSPNCVLKTPYEALILASIVEKETSCEHRHVAGVYSNRLKKRMRLQADPTVIYGITKGKTFRHILSLTDLKKKSPYNTYTNSGLPPTPIAAPSRKSITAALHPENTPNLFFVYDPSISRHVFSKDYDTHRKHVTRIRKQKKQNSGTNKSAI